MIYKRESFKNIFSSPNKVHIFWNIFFKRPAWNKSKSFTNIFSLSFYNDIILKHVKKNPLVLPKDRITSQKIFVKGCFKVGFYKEFLEGLVRTTRAYFVQKLLKDWAPKINGLKYFVKDLNRHWTFLGTLRCIEGGF